WTSIALAVASPRRATTATVSITWVIPVFVLVAAVQLVARRAEDQRISKKIETLTGLVNSGLGNIDNVRIHIPADRWGPVAGVVLKLAREGKHPTVDADWVPMFGTRYGPSVQETASVTFADRDQHERSLQYRVDQRLAGFADPFFLYVSTPKPM